MCFVWVTALTENIFTLKHRSIFALSMIDFMLRTVGSAEGREDRNKVAFLYDIGCNVEKGILKVCTY